MHIVFNPNSTLALLKYGIEIPVTDFRDQLIASAMNELNIPVEVINERLNLISKDDVIRVHKSDFVSRLENPQTLIHEIMNCFELVKPDGSYNRYNPQKAIRDISELYQCILQKINTSLYAANYCLQGQDAFLLGGGFHHAMSFAGRGFCLLNDVVITLEKLRADKKIQSAWIIDVDAHKGDGSAELTVNNPHLSTLSIHMKYGWPLDNRSSHPEENTEPWFIPSTVDIEIEQGEESHYVNKLKYGLLELEEKTKRPDMAVVVLGADPYEKDELPSAFLIKLTLLQMLERDLLVHAFLKERQIPVLYVMGGGYGAHSHEPYVQFLRKIFNK